MVAAIFRSHKTACRHSAVPLSETAVTCFRQLQNEQANSALKAVHKTVPFTLETDASDVALSAVLHLDGRAVTFWSRTLGPNEKRYAGVEKEAAAIVESVRKWSHFLLPHKFTIITAEHGMEGKMERKGKFWYGIWKIPDWNGTKGFKNEMEGNPPY